MHKLSLYLDGDVLLVLEHGVIEQDQVIDLEHVRPVVLLEHALARGLVMSADVAPEFVQHHTALVVSHQLVGVCTYE